MVMNRTETIIHIGYHKTGTTFLQRQVFPALKANLVMAPDVAYIAKSKDYNPERFVEILKSQYILDKYERTVISQEALSGRAASSADWNEYLIARRLYQTFPNAKFLIVIRNQLEYVLSLYTFRVVKRGLERRNLSTYLEQIFKDSLQERLQYDKLVKHYIHLFGKENILVLAYEQLNEDHDRFVSEILKFMNINDMIEYNPQKVNKGVRNLKIVNANRLLNCPISIITDFLRRKNVLSQKKYSILANEYFRFKRRRVNPVLERILNECSQDIDLDKKWKNVIIAACKESNRRLADIVNIDLLYYGYPW